MDDNTDADVGECVYECVCVCVLGKFAAKSTQVVLVFVSLFVALCLASVHTIQVFVCLSSSLHVCVCVHNT